jgi:hypothetical protein
VFAGDDVESHDQTRIVTFTDRTVNFCTPARTMQVVSGGDTSQGSTFTFPVEGTHTENQRGVKDMRTARLVSRCSHAIMALAILSVPCASSLHGEATLREVPDTTGKRDSAAQSSRMHAYVIDLIGLGAIASVGVGSAVDQLRNDPTPWGKTGSGFGKRVASNAGSRAAAVTTRHALAAALDRSTVYVRCTCTDGGARFSHGIVAAFTDVDSHGRRVFSEPILAGAVAGAFTPLIWRPNYSVGTAVANTAISFGLAAAGNVMREFISWWP